MDTGAPGNSIEDTGGGGADGEIRTRSPLVIHRVQQIHHLDKLNSFPTLDFGLFDASLQLS